MLSTETLANLVAHKLQLLELLAKLSRAQMELIDGGDMTKLLAVLGAKQKLLSQLQQLDQALVPFRDEDPDQRVWPSPEARQECQAQATQIEALLREIMLLERQGEAEMVRRRDDTARRLEEVEYAGRAQSAYLDMPLPAATQFDMSSDQ
jgi:flagellar biosynthesis/type III secretory pathway chaperone